jgi:hypothetical protein
MSGQTIPLNSVPNDPNLSDLLNLLKKEIFLDLNCHHVGTIQSFNSTNQTVYATVNYTKTFFQLNTVTGLYSPVQVNYPTLINCPLIILGGGTAHMTFPVAKGDECLLLFNDRDIDNWWAAGTTTQAVATSRLHSFSDAFALVGVKSTPNVLTAYDAVRALLTNGNVSVGINPSTNKVTIQNTASGTLNTTLQSILTQLQNLTTALGTTYASNLILVTASPGSPSPINPTAATAIANIGTQLSTLATTLGGLLE